MHRNFLNKMTHVITVLLLSIAGSVALAGELQFGGFSQLNFSASDSENSNSNSFAQGGIDLYLSKSLDEKTNILAEIVFEISEENEAILDPERIWIQHEVHPWFRVKAGRVHTALGYWNENYHHGTWLQTTVSRPILLGFEDDGGILPVHNIGLELRGSGDVGVGELGYIVNFGNGRGENPDPPQSGSDYDRNKSYSVLAYYHLQNIGLRFGLVFHSDKMEAASDFNDDGDEATPGVSRAGFDEGITGAHLVWNQGNTEVIFEGFSVNHKYDVDTLTALNEKDNTITAYYLQASHKFNKWTPYARYGIIQSDKDEADVYLALPGDDEQKATTLGVRYDLTYTSALKFEYGNVVRTTAGTELANVKNYTLNWSYAW